MLRVLDTGKKNFIWCSLKILFIEIPLTKTALFRSCFFLLIYWIINEYALSLRTYELILQHTSPH